MKKNRINKTSKAGAKKPKSAQKRKCSLCGVRGHIKTSCEKNPDRGKLSAAQLKQRQDAAEGNGAERSHSYFEEFADVEKPPEDPLERNIWAQKIVTHALWLTIRGFGSTELNNEIRRLSASIVELTPRERLLKAEQLIRGDGLAKKPKRRKAGTTTARRGTKPLR